MERKKNQNKLKEHKLCTSQTEILEIYVCRLAST